MNIQEYISELLYEHDCVIVPDFGGFVCNYVPAHIDPVKHLFEPPGKKILFNKGLTRNDGLLAHHISGKLKVPYSQVIDSIAKEVKLYKEELQKDKRLTLDNIGLLYIDEKGSLLFQQDNRLNYLAESFGLAAFYHLPVEQEKEEGKVIPLYNERKKLRSYAAAAVISALAISTFYFALVQKQTTMPFSNLNIFAKKEAPKYVFSPSTYKELPKPVFEPFNTVAVSTKVSTVTNTSVSSSYYYIIAGSFIQKEHADNLIAQFNKQNIHLSIIGRTPAGLYMVGYGKYMSHQDATAEKDKFREKFVKDAWIKAN